MSQGEDQQPSTENEQHAHNPASPNSMLHWCRRFLHQTDPAMILLLAMLSLTLAAIATYLSIRTSTGADIDFMQSQIREEYLYPANSGSRFLGGMFGILAFALGLLGGLLPMWAVGRLIADAIVKGNNQ